MRPRHSERDKIKTPGLHSGQWEQMTTGSLAMPLGLPSPGWKLSWWIRSFLPNCPSYLWLNVLKKAPSCHWLSKQGLLGKRVLLNCKSELEFQPQDQGGYGVIALRPKDDLLGTWNCTQWITLSSIYFLFTLSWKCWWAMKEQTAKAEGRLRGRQEPRGAGAHSTD